MAFLDDPYHLLRTPLARVTLELVTGVETYAGSSANLKKSIFNYEGGSPPLGVADLGPEVWRGDRPPQQRGFIAVGIPIATPEYFRAWGTERLETETDCSTCSVRGSSLASAPHPELTTRSRPSLPMRTPPKGQLAGLFGHGMHPNINRFSIHWGVTIGARLGIYPNINQSSTL